MSDILAISFNIIKKIEWVISEEQPIYLNRHSSGRWNPGGCLHENPRKYEMPGSHYFSETGKYVDFMLLDFGHFLYECRYYCDFSSIIKSRYTPDVIPAEAGIQNAVDLYSCFRRSISFTVGVN